MQAVSLSIQRAAKPCAATRRRAHPPSPSDLPISRLFAVPDQRQLPRRARGQCFGCAPQHGEVTLALCVPPGQMGAPRQSLVRSGRKHLETCRPLVVLLVWRQQVISKPDSESVSPQRVHPAAKVKVSGRCTRPARLPCQAPTCAQGRSLA